MQNMAPRGRKSVAQILPDGQLIDRSRITPSELENLTVTHNLRHIFY